MSRLQELHPDQQAVLQLVLRRRMTYADIGGLLGLDSDAVRERALDAVDGLAPDDVDGLELADRDRIADLLLGQGPDADRDATRQLLRDHAPARTWATRVAAELIELGGPVEALPEASPAAGDAIAPAVPATDETALLRADGPAAASPAPVPAAAAAAAAAPAAAGGSGDVRDAFAALDDARGAATDDGAPAGRRRRPSPLALAGGAVALVLVAFVIAWVGGAFKSDDEGDADAAAPAAPTTTTTGAADDAQAFLAALPRQINFSAPVGAQPPYANAKGVAQSTLSQTTGEPVLALTTEGVPKASKTRRYFAWADKSGADPILIGQLTDARGAELPFTGVDLKTRQAAAVDPTVYNRIRVTRQTASAPTKPGPTVLVGTLRTRPAN